MYKNPRSVFLEKNSGRGICTILADEKTVFDGKKMAVVELITDENLQPTSKGLLFDIRFDKRIIVRRIARRGFTV